MKATDNFNTTIKAYLDKRAAEDSLFAISYAKKEKNINDCCIYIINQVKKSGCNGFSDDEVFGMAVHYYDEDKIELGSKISCQIVTNHPIELTEEEKEKARKEAIKKAQDEAYKAYTNKPKAKKKAEVVNSPSLFDEP